MADFFITHNRFTALLMLALIGFGLYAVVMIPKESAPEVQVPVGVITSSLPGASAAEIETRLTNEIERGLAGSLTDVDQITSVSREGLSEVTVEFEASADIDESISELKDQVDTIVPDLPDDATEPVVTEIDFVDQPIFTLSVAGELGVSEFRAVADAVEATLESVTGVREVEVSGVQESEVSVLIEQAALAQYNLSINEVVQALQAANQTFPIGDIETDQVSYSVAFAGDIPDPAAVRDIPVTARGGQPVYVSDLGTVSVGFTEASTQSRLSVDGDPSENAITFSVYKQRGGDITALTDTLRAEIDALSATGEPLEDLTTYVVQDAGDLIEQDLLQLTSSGLQTVILVVLLLVIAIGWREGLIAGTAIPLSFTIGFIGLYLSGNTINFISLFALILGIGVLVDSGIVMVEGINRRMKDDPTIDKRQAAIATIREFASPLIAGTLTTVSMFTGLFIVSGVTGQFISSIPFTLIFVLFASLLVALGFLPVIAAWLLRRRSATRIEQAQVEYSRRLESWYASKLRHLLSQRSRKLTFLGLLIAGFFGALSLVPLGAVPVVFFAQGDAEQLFVEVELAEGTTKEVTDIATRRIEDILYSYDDVIEAFTTTVGAGSAFAGGGQNEKLGNFYLVLREERVRTSTEIAEALRADSAELRDLDITVSQPNAGPPTGSPIGVRLLGEDLPALNAAAGEVADLVRDIESTTNVRTSSNVNSTEIVLELDRARAASLDLSPQAISQTLRAAVFGTDATTLTTLTDEVEVVVRLNLSDTAGVDPAAANQTTVNALENISLTTPAGESVLLGSLVEVSLRESSTVIDHEDQERVVTVSADTTPEGNVRAITEELRTRIDTELSLDESITVRFGGETEESNQAFGELFLALIVGVVLMIAVLVLQFNSFRHTFYVLSILPFSLIGILFGLAATGSALSFPSIMGFIALSGIVVNNSILLIDLMNTLRRREPALPIQEVVVVAATKRLRPILLTTLTTIIGMVPLLTASEIWVPLATAIMFGLAFSVVITLILIPIIYSKFPGPLRS